MEVKEFFTTKEISQMYQVKESYLRKLRHTQKGPRYYLFGRQVKYKTVDVDIWFKQAIQVVEPQGVI